jgi:DNA (cytosine-5)-methyltransferase 1
MTIMREREIEVPARAAKPVAVDLFAGAGGFSCGFHMAGWHVAAAVEFDKDAAATYLANLGSPDTRVHVLVDGVWTDERAEDFAPGLAGTGWIASRGEPAEEQANEYLTKINEPAPADVQPCEHFYFGDVRSLPGQRILDDLGLDVGEVGAVFGGPPCQGYSMNGKRQVMDPRNSMVFEFGRIVLELMPKTMVLENVPGMLTMVTPDGLPVVDALALFLSRGGYSEYKALQRSLRHNPDARAAVRGQPTGPEPDQCGDAEPAQPDLFSEVSS